MQFFIYALVDTLNFLSPLLPLAMAALVTEYTGVLNVALEGIVLLSAFVFACVGNAYGFQIAAIITIIFSASFSFAANAFSKKFKADHFVVDLGINILAPSLTSVLSMKYFGTKAVFFIPVLKSERIFADANLLFNPRFSVLLCLFATIIIMLIIQKTPLYSAFVSAGQNKDALRLAGKNPDKIESYAYIISGCACALSGISLVSDSGAWIPNMSNGRGWLALVVVYLGGRTMKGTVSSCVLFSFMLALSMRAQSFVNFPADILNAIPYFAAAIVIIGLGNKDSKHRLIKK